jgi:micrococcal nuclease
MSKKKLLSLFCAFIVVFISALLGLGLERRDLNGSNGLGGGVSSSGSTGARPTQVPSLPALNSIPPPPIGLVAPSGTVFAFVVRVIDGDTIRVNVDGKEDTVRYIGMDTPESVSPKKPVECFAHEAAARNKELVEGKYVYLQKDVSNRDQYGRLLRFVYVSSTFVNLELVKEGYARVYRFPPDFDHQKEFVAAAAEAKSANLGFWARCAMSPFL